jgi:Ino eighty subunit 1
MASITSSRGSPGRWSQPSSTPGTPRDGSPEANLDSSVLGPDSAHGSKRKSRASTAGAGAASASGGGSFPVIGKIRHLKKEDGEPLWRRDIQYDFLRAVFDDDTKVFTNSYEPGKSEKQSFADLYIDTMARSSKTSKVLRDKLLSDREAAKGMAMVCLLVNVGRMNTTLNCMVASNTATRGRILLTHTLSSFPRNASPTKNLPRHSVATGTSGCIGI